MLPLSPMLIAHNQSAHQIIWKDENVTAMLRKTTQCLAKDISLSFSIIYRSAAIGTHSASGHPAPNSASPFVGRQLIHATNENANPPPSPGPNAAPNLPLTPTSPFRVGFITPPFRDSKIPVTDHLHVHAYIGTTDLAGWWRAMAYSSVGWYSIEDLIAEIRRGSARRSARRPELNDLPLAADGLGAAGDRGSRSPSRSSSMDNQPGPSRRDSHIPLMRVTTPDIVVENADEARPPP
ncbi:hypothetical protein RHS01_02711 [Rhizoctonia solani]|uniref:Uncharacterized protein n=1 Tax=Rhizoctonia solani TaxID=456999 RepID=A0A8H7M3X5_9AGAM|nr:hypothetical protein RHS01_02711 [Rhizoctonia solani]